MTSFASWVAAGTSVIGQEAVREASKTFVSIVLVAGLAGTSAFSAFSISEEEPLLAFEAVLRVEIGASDTIGVANSQDSSTVNDQQDQRCRYHQFSTGAVTGAGTTKSWTDFAFRVQ